MTVVELFELGGIYAWLGLAVVIAILFAINRKHKKSTAPSIPDNNQAVPVVNTAPAAGAILAEGEILASISAAITQYRKNNNA